MYNQNKVSEKLELQEGVHFEIVKNKAGYGYKYAILDHECWCPKSGIVEIRNMKNNLTLQNTPKNDGGVTVKRFRDKETGLLFGLHSGIDDRTGDIKHYEILLDGNMQFDLSIPHDRRQYIMASRGPSVLGSPNQSGKPNYILFDKEVIASKNNDNRSLRRKAEDIVESMKDAQLREMAMNVGINVNANNSPKMLLDEVYRFIENKVNGVLGAKRFIEVYENKDREIITIYHKARSLGIITQDYVTNTFSFGGVPLGVGEEASIQFLIEKRQMAYVIKQQCEVTDKGTVKSMAFAEKPEDAEKKALLARIAELEAKQLKDLESADIEAEKEPLSEDAEMTELRKEAKELKISSWALPAIKKETLRAKVEEAKAKLV